MKMDKLIINVAVTGMVPGKKDSPHVPITPDEIAEDCHRCYQTGASVFHLHARDESGEPTYRSDRYRDIITKVRDRCPDAIICISTSGRVFKSFEQRSEVLNLDGNVKPDMASLTLGSLNFPIDYTSYKGDLPGADSQESWRVTFQPILPYPLGQGVNLFFRPAIPLVYKQPVPVVIGGDVAIPGSGLPGSQDQNFDDSDWELGDVSFDLAIGKKNIP